MLSFFGLPLFPLLVMEDEQIKVKLTRICGYKANSNRTECLNSSLNSKLLVLFHVKNLNGLICIEDGTRMLKGTSCW